MLGPPPTGLKRGATVPTLPRPHHTHPPAQRVRSSAILGRPGANQIAGNQTVRKPGRKQPLATDTKH